MFSKKSQAAMEFLMTYGWAILIVLIVIGVFWQLGVFNVLFVPERCVIGGGYLNCQDFGVQDNQITLLVANAASVDLEISRIDITSQALQTPCYNDTVHILKAAERTTLIADTDPATGASCAHVTTVGNQRNKYVINITYHQVDSTFGNKNLAGDILASKQG